MSDRKSRKRQRVGDATRQRIDGLAGGWKIAADDTGEESGKSDSKPSDVATAEGSNTAARARPSRPPPPPPGKSTGSQPALAPAPPPPPGTSTGPQRAIKPSSPPPLPPGASTGSQRAIKPSSPPPPPKSTGSQRAIKPSSPPPPPKSTGSQPAPQAGHGTGSQRAVKPSSPPPPPKSTGSQRALEPPPPQSAGSQPALGAGSPPPSRREAPSESPPVIAAKDDRGESTVHDPEAAERLASAEKQVAAKKMPPAARVSPTGDIDEEAETEIAPPRSSRLPPAPRVSPTGDVDEEAETIAVAPRKMPPPAPVSAAGVDDDAETEIASRDLDDEVPRARPGSGARTGSVRVLVTLPRESGVVGDLGYLWRVLRRVPAARRELDRLEDKLIMEREGRLQRLLEVARNALADADLDTTLVGRAREHLVTLEEMRSRHAGAVAAADEEVGAIERERDEATAERQEERASLRGELEAVEARLEPLRKRQVAARKRFAAVQRSLAKLDAELTVAEGKLAAADGTADAAALEAALASTRAERESIAAEEPDIADELDALEPKIASLDAERGDMAERIAKLAEADERARVRADEKLAAVRATQTVEDRAASDLASERQDALLALGESLSDQRPAQFNRRLRSVEEQDMIIATLHRRIVEIREELEGIERWAVARGALWAVLALGLVGALVLFVLSR